jgi:hypothetical protein
MPLTPEQFDKLVTKDEFNEFKDEMMEMKSDVKKMLSSMDSQAKILNSIKDEHTANIGAHDRFEERITKLEESKITINS